MARDGWRFFATNLDRAGGETLVINDLPLAGSQITSTLSGPGGISGTIPVKVARLTDDAGLPLLRPWQTCIYAELGGIIRGGGVIAEDIDIDDGPVALSAKGFSAYPTGQPYKGEKNYVQADPFDMAREFWQELQAQPHSNIGLDVVCSPSRTPIRLGRLPAAQWTTIDLDKLEKAHAKAPLLSAGTPFVYTYTDYDSSGHARKVTRYGLASRASHYTNDPFPEMWWDTGTFTTNRGRLLIWDNGTIEEQYVYDKAHSVFPPGMVDGVIRDSSGKVVWAIFGYITSKEPKQDDDGTTLEAYKKNYFDTLDQGSWWDSLCKDGGFDYYETHEWATGTNPDPKVGDPVDIVHTLHLGYPTVGRDLRQSETHRFQVGSNVTVVPTVSLAADDCFDEVLVIGSGNGRAAVRGIAPVTDQGRLHRTKVIQDPTIKSTALAMKRAAQEASNYAGDQNVRELKIANRSFAPLGSYGVGDTIQLLGSGRGWSANLKLPLRMTEISVSPDDGDYATASVARPDKVNSEV